MSDYPPPPPPQGGYGAPPPPPGGGQSRPGELGDRFLARLIDGLILGVVFAVLFFLFAALLISDTTINFQTGEVDEGSTLLFGIVFGIFAAAINLGYAAFLESSRGATIGKQAMKLQVVGPDGHSNPTLEQAIRRNILLAAGIGYIIPVVGAILAGIGSLVGWILIAVGINNDPVKRQAWHDQFAGGTRVIKIG